MEMPVKYEQGSRVWVTVNGRKHRGTVKHVSNVRGLPAPYVIDYDDENGNAQVHNASAQELSPRR